jgi:hypothetical protein
MSTMKIRDKYNKVHQLVFHIQQYIPEYLGVSTQHGLFSAAITSGIFRIYEKDAEQKR